MAKSKIEKYVIHCDTDVHVWWARVPYGTYMPFRSWSDAAKHLTIRHNLRK